MINGLELQMIIAREKRLDLLRRAERDRLIRLARAEREAQARAGCRTWDRLRYRLCQLRLGGHADRRSSMRRTGRYLLDAFTWGSGRDGRC